VLQAFCSIADANDCKERASELADDLQRRATTARQLYDRYLVGINDGRTSMQKLCATVASNEATRRKQQLLPNA
jgi:hypothetical protein